ncbi:MAG: class I SAM-dependent methyltransferase [Thermoplasmata archaeon]
MGADPGRPGWIRRVFGVPTSRWAGWFLARFNGPMNRRLVARLELEGHEQALEIGPGPGVALEAIARRLPNGRVTGLDPSPVMRSMAEARLRRSFPPERYRLEAGEVDSMPFPNAAFDAIYSANSVQLWTPLEPALREITRVAAPGARLVLGVQEVAIRGAGRTVPELFDPLVRALSPPAWRVESLGRGGVGRLHYRYVEARRAWQGSESAAGRA